MKILLLGATGQIGQVLMEALSRTGHQVSTLVRNAAGQQFPEGVTTIEHSEFTPDAFKVALHDINHVIYGIGLPEQFLFDNSIFGRVNCDLLRTFLDVLRGSGILSLTYISTYEVFMAIDNEIDETHPVADESEMIPYFQSMIHAYRMVVDFARATNLRLTTIHPAAVYGGRNTGGGITDYMENCSIAKLASASVHKPKQLPGRARRLAHRRYHQVPGKARRLHR